MIAVVHCSTKRTVSTRMKSRNVDGMDKDYLYIAKGRIGAVVATQSLSAWKIRSAFGEVARAELRFSLARWFGTVVESTEVGRKHHHSRSALE